MFKNKSKYKIFYCLLLSFLIPTMIIMINQFVDSPTISTTLIFNFVTFIIVITNNRLLSLHLKRFKNDFTNSLAYVFAIIVLLLIIYLLNYTFNILQFSIIDFEVLHTYSFHSLTIICAYTLAYAIITCITFKLLTDKFPYKNNPVTIILNSTIANTAFFTLSYITMFLVIPFDLSIVFELIIVNFVLSIVIAYSYNQTRSLITPILAISISVLIIIFTK